MTGLRVVLHKELLEQVRTMRMLAVGGLFVVMGLLSPVLAKYTPEMLASLAPAGMTITIPTPTIADAIGQLVKNLSQFGALAAILIAMGSVAAEKERGTAAMVLSKPVGRGAFLTAKLVAIGATLGIATAAGCAAAFVYTAMLFETPAIGGFVAMCVLLWLSLMVYAGLTFLGSTLAKSILPAAALGIIFLAILGALAILPTVGAFTPAGLTTIAEELAVGEPAEHLVGSVAVNSALVCGSLALAWVSLRRQEL